MPLADDFVRKACRPGRGEGTCVFLMNSGMWTCAKGTQFESVLRERKDTGTSKAKGDNCTGPPNFQLVQ